ncbi:protein translocase subunit SecD [Anaerobacillus isosaccharinicus]|uniref:Protein translocase subunit SecD n=1 Tax=Anaerobacillus isosaccharinicus TaxID=1532552 RepID=A0A7S7L8E4_9BACI|nr:protein translocase subunit SecD [Anaerobacillus isosaccharinicus]MBA5585362.1 protein translocase subunit SecD [Anaerobacillus isosaccharinicus]QOY36317.1 protein translocase subunit SecD [Anaerobacillus isosaccharinicus]
MVKKGRIVAFFLIVALLAGLVVSTVMDVAKEIKLGLDLQGGFEVLYEVHPAHEGDVIDDDVLKSTVTALNQRINVIGVSEPNVSIEGDSRIRVQLAGVEDQQTARELLSTEAQLSFRDVNDNLMLDGADLRQGGASVTFSEANQPWVGVTLNSASQFAEVTRQVLNSQLVIWMDYEEGDSFMEERLKPESEQKFISAPSVDQVLNTTNVVIRGTFTLEEAQFLADVLNAGSLPVKLEEVYSNSVGAALGEKAMEMTIYAGFIGVALIFLYMLIYYRFMGIIAVITLSFYIYLVLVIFNWMNAVLTLPGIAALILGVGMAVDANIITYERIKDELRTGKTTMSAFKAGSRRSLSTILDANITTILAAAVLFYFGTMAVQGFAVMLIVSILTSFITAVYGSRLLLGLWVNSRILNKKPRMFGVKESEINEL